MSHTHTSLPFRKCKNTCPLNIVYTWPGHLSLVSSLWTWAFARTYPPWLCETCSRDCSLFRHQSESEVPQLWSWDWSVQRVKVLNHITLRGTTNIGSMFRCFLLPGIDDIIVNSVALSFLLTLDETITDAMLSAEAKLRSSNVGNTHDSKHQNVPKVNRSCFSRTRFK